MIKGKDDDVEHDESREEWWNASLVIVSGMRQSGRREGIHFSPARTGRPVRRQKIANRDRTEPTCIVGSKMLPF